MKGVAGGLRKNGTGGGGVMAMLRGGGGQMGVWGMAAIYRGWAFIKTAFGIIAFRERRASKMPFPRDRPWPSAENIYRTPSHGISVHPPGVARPRLSPLATSLEIVVSVTRYGRQ